MPQNQGKKDISHKVLFPRIAKLCREARAKTPWSQTDVSMKMGWKNGQFMSNIERGLCSLPSKYLMKFCDVLKIPVENVIDAMVEDYKAALWKDASDQAVTFKQPEERRVGMSPVLGFGYGLDLNSEAI
jgi:transcriptional regulator with XRE-family HTH domain